MSIEWANFWFSKEELKDNNFNPELSKFLENNDLSSEEANMLTEMFEENKSWVILISKANLYKLRSVIWSNSKANYITFSDKKKVASYVPKDYFEEETSTFFDWSKHVDEDWFLNDVSKVRLDQIVWPSEKIRFSISLWKSSLYPNNMDWNTYNVVWWINNKNWKQAYIFEEWPRKWQRVMISNWDKLWEYIEKYKSSDLLETSTDNEKISDTNDKNIDFIENLNLPNNYKEIALSFISKLDTNEILDKTTPLALVDSWTKEMLYLINWESTKVKVLLWAWWLTDWWYKIYDKKTPILKIHRFDPDISKISDSLNWDASNSGRSKTVKSASLQSELSVSFWWRYFHWVSDRRLESENTATWWCVWVDVHTIRTMYHDVKRKWYGYWYVW